MATKHDKMIEALRAAEAAARGEAAGSLLRLEKMRDSAVEFKLHLDKEAAAKAAMEAWPDDKQRTTRSDFTACAAAASEWATVETLARATYDALPEAARKRERLANFFLRGARVVREEGRAPTADEVKGKEKEKKKLTATTVRAALGRIVKKAAEAGLLVDLEPEEVTIRVVKPASKPAQDKPPVDIAALLKGNPDVAQALAALLSK